MFEGEGAGRRGRERGVAREQQRGQLDIFVLGELCVSNSCFNFAHLNFNEY